MQAAPQKSSSLACRSQRPPSPVPVSTSIAQLPRVILATDTAGWQLTIRSPGILQTRAKALNSGLEPDDMCCLLSALMFAQAAPAVKDTSLSGTVHAIYVRERATTQCATRCCVTTHTSPSTLNSQHTFCSSNLKKCSALPRLASAALQRHSVRAATTSGTSCACSELCVHTKL